MRLRMITFENYLLTMTMLVLFLFVFCLTQVVWPKALLDLENAEHHFEIFIKEHNKHYANEEEKQARFAIFKDNLEKAIQMNEESDHATFGITQFMDLNIEEFLSLHTGLRIREYLTERSRFCKMLTDADIPDVKAPESFDWREYHAVTPSRKQGDCGSCYAFSITGNIEGQYAIKYNKLIELSKQQIVDCDGTTNGCRGGDLTATLRWLIDNGGLQAEADYPYASIDGVETMCKFDENKVTVKIADCFSYNITSAEKLKQLLFLNGPLSVAERCPLLDIGRPPQIIATSNGSVLLASSGFLQPYGIVPHSLKDYKNGVLTDQNCIKNRPITHGVLLVGYGIDEKGMPYWTLKDSQGESFGEKGFFRIERGEGVNTCKMQNHIVTSVIA